MTASLSFKISNLILMMIFLIIGLNIQSGICYVLFFLTCALFVMSLVGRRVIYLRITPLDFIPAIFLAVWLYGVCLGFYNRNKLEYILANNAGMVLYFLYYVLLQVQVSKQKIYNCILGASLTIGCITLLLYITNTIGIPETYSKLILGDFTGGSSTGQRRVYFVAQIALFPALAVYLCSTIGSNLQKAEWWKLTTLGSKVNSLFLFFLYTVFIVFFTSSKGFMLGFLFLMVILPIAIFYKRFSDGYVNKKILVFFLLIVLLFVALISLGYINIITAMFDNDDTANVARYEQLYYILSDLTFWGKGLGAVIPAYSRSLDKPYGFELSYLSLIHKFGIFSLLLVILYVCTLVACMKNVFKNRDARYAILGIGAMGYLLPSIGNPLLFAPEAVVFHCLTLYLIRKDRVYE